MSKISNAEWLDSLPQYMCPTCSESTIFKSGCTKCDDLIDKREELASLLKGYQNTTAEVSTLIQRLNSIRKDISDIREWLKDNDPTYMDNL